MVEKVKEGMMVKKVDNVIIFPIVIGILLMISIILMVIIIFMYIKKNRRKHEFPTHQIYQTPHTATAYYQQDRVVEDTDPIYQEPILKNSVDNFSFWKQGNMKYEILGVQNQEVIYSIPGGHNSIPNSSSPLTESSTTSLSSLKTLSHSRSEKVEDFITFCPIYSSYLEQEYSNLLK